MARKTGFDKYFDEQMKKPSFARAHAAARAEIDAIDRIVRELDAARDRLGMSKADLARASGIRADLVRRLFSADAPNPTVDTLLRVMAAVGQTIAVVPMKKPRKRARAQARTHRGTRARYSSPRRRTAA